MAPHNRKTPTGTLMVLALVGAALLAGCAGLGNSNDDGNRAPTAQLQSDKDSGNVGDAFTFDGQGSKDTDGNVTSWRFDFGDGSNASVETADAARVKHAYTHGGDFVVTLTVVDDGTHDGLERKSDSDTVRVSVDQRFPVAATVVKTPLNDSAAARMAMPFRAYDGADKAVANLTLQSTLLTGASEVRVRILDPAGKVLQERTVVLNDTTPKALSIEAPLSDTGNHTFEVLAQSGAARVTGDLQVVYSETVAKSA
jgi:PKD repeat protein